jgi:hypothetical protein
MSSLTYSAVVMTSVTGSQNGNVTTWTLPANGYIMTATKNSDGSISYHLTMQGLDYMVGTLNADGKSGNWNLFDAGTKVSDLVWTTDANNTLTGTWQSYSSGTTVSNKTVLINNADKSGDCKYYNYTNGTLITWRVVWNAAKHGTWYTYNISGTQTGTGTF